MIDREEAMIDKEEAIADEDGSVAIEALQQKLTAVGDQADRVEKVLEELIKGLFPDAIGTSKERILKMLKQR